MSHELEEGLKLNLDFTKIAKVAANIKEDKDHVIPVAIQHADTKEVILVAYTNGTHLQDAHLDLVVDLSQCPLGKG